MSLVHVLKLTSSSTERFSSLTDTVHGFDKPSIYRQEFANALYCTAATNKSLNLRDSPVTMDFYLKFW